VRQDQRERHRSHGGRGQRWPPVPDLLPRPGAQPGPQPLRRSAADPNVRSARRPDQGGARMSPAEAKQAEPVLVRPTKEWTYTSPLLACRIDPASQYVFAGAQDSTVQRWDLATGEKKALARHQSWVRALAFLPDGKTFFTGGYDGKVIAWSAE